MAAKSNVTQHATVTAGAIAGSVLGTVVVGIVHAVEPILSGAIVAFFSAAVTAFTSWLHAKLGGADPPAAS
jgi:hypothetical protein